jgi:hypothetical protein
VWSPDPKSKGYPDIAIISESNLIPPDKKIITEVEKEDHKL